MLNIEIQNTKGPKAYLIFVRKAGNAMSVKFLAECKIIPAKNEKITALGSVYIAAVMYYFTLSV